MSSTTAAVLTIKLHAPAVDPHQVRRQSIVDAITQSQARLVLVRAPAGFGKTTVLAQARQQLHADGAATAWITLDSADNDPSRFLAHLAAALNESLDAEHPGLPDKAIGEAALQVMERVAASGSPFTLFLDEFETINAPGVLSFLVQLLDSLPAGGRVVIASRNAPDLRLGRLRASGKLLEIDAQRLRFSLDETRAFFGARTGEQLQENLVQLLQGKTEGWVAALWLAWVAIEHHPRRAVFIADFSGTEKSIAEYLAEEVLSQQPAPVRNLLLCSSVLREISAPLCHVLVPDVDAETLLQQLASANAFLIPTTERPGQWRYHNLFASFLRAQLQKAMPQAIPRLHRAAAQWFLAQERPVPAVEHFIAAGDIGDAVGVLRREAMPLLMQGRLRLLYRWFESLPEDALFEEPALQVAHAWATYYNRGPQAALALLRGTGLAASTDAGVKTHVAGLQTSMLALLDRWEEAHAVGSRSLHLVPSPSVFADASLVNVTATAATVVGAFAEARSLLVRARQGQGSGASAFHRMYSETVEGMIDLQQGRLRQARARFRLAVHTTQQSTLDATQGNAWAGLFYAITVYETDDPQQAKRLLQVYLPLARDTWLPDHIILGYRTLSRIAFAEGEVDQALQGLSELEYLGHERQLPRLVAAARLERARLLLLQGHTVAAGDELRHAGTPELWQVVAARRHPGHDTEDAQIGLLRWQAVAGDARAAVPALETAAQRARQDVLVRREHTLRLLQSVALARSGDTAAAQATLLQVLVACCAEGAMRLVIDERPPVALVAALCQSSSDDPHADPILVDYLQRLRLALGPPGTEDTDMARGPVSLPPLMEPLTPKEIRLLQLLAEGYSNRALTEKLFVSDSTVRTHLRNINGKLGAANRTQAVAIGRRLGLVR